jgi:hypothetical protein
MDDRRTLARTIARTLALALAAICFATPAAASAGQPPRTRDQLRDAIYCEVFTIQLAGGPIATVWNSIGFHECPQPWWESLDTSALAAEHGADLALLNGPRNFIMDSATSKDYGPVSSFAGKRMRQVATIDLSATGLAPPPRFTDVRITRRNTWRWAAGKRVFELVAPTGRVYIMQSYSRQVDPALTYAQLPGLGSRVGLPEGWSYRVRRLSENLVLFSKGAAYVTQDELGNTYQRLPRRLAE